MEEKIREILRETVLRTSIEASAKLGTRVAERFKQYGLDGEIEEFRGQPAKPADLTP
jgi:hypothetical protein